MGGRYTPGTDSIGAVNFYAGSEFPHIKGKATAEAAVRKYEPVTIADGKISAVEIVEQHETAGVADKAISDLPAAIVAENSVNVDTISGCTLSSGRILDAVTDCLNQASAQ